MFVTFKAWFLLFVNWTKPGFYCVLDILLFLRFIYDRVQYFLSQFVPFDTFSRYLCFVFCAQISGFFSAELHLLLLSWLSHLLAIVPIMLITLITTPAPFNSEKI